MPQKYILFCDCAANFAKKGVDTSVLRVIDRLVYHLYGLTYEEVLVIDPMPPFAREEYEK